MCVSHGPTLVIVILMWFSFLLRSPLLPHLSKDSLTLKAGGMTCKGCLRLLDLELVFSAPHPHLSKDAPMLTGCQSREGSKAQKWRGVGLRGARWPGQANRAIGVSLGDALPTQSPWWKDTIQVCSMGVEEREAVEWEQKPSAFTWTKPTHLSGSERPMCSRIIPGTDSRQNYCLECYYYLFGFIQMWIQNMGKSYTFW